ncbi:MAG TPA: hypothetical protein VMZ71_07850 [Gemmataceae bacterium]|nr:hypothetical protein [Gemmataceae bacterium]
MSNRRGAAALLLSLLLLAGCGDGGMGEVSGTVTVDSQVPAEGSSITFLPTDGKGTGGGGLLQSGQYTTKLAAGTYKVEIRIPKPVGKMPKAAVEPGPGGPGPGGPGGPANIEESLPPKYNDKTELKFEVKPGKNEKNWEVSATGK